MRIIDVHTHPILRESNLARGDAERFIARAKAHGIVHAVVLGDVLAYGAKPTEQQVREINDDTAWLVREHPDYITGFCYLNPTLGEKHVRREIARCVELGLKGIKLEIANNAADPCMRPLMEEAEARGLVVLQHSWSMTKIRQRSFHTDPEDVAELARRHPGVRIVMAHLTGDGVRGVLAVENCPNVYVDTSGAAPESGIVEYAVEKLGADRILYGSDVPIRDFAVAIARVAGSRLDARAKKKILHDNTRALLSIP